jgi:hypothetical protein
MKEDIRIKCRMKVKCDHACKITTKNLTCFITRVYYISTSVLYIAGKVIFSVILKFAINTRVYPKVSRLAAWRENCKWYSSLPLDAVVSLFCESV